MYGTDRASYYGHGSVARAAARLGAEEFALPEWLGELLDSTPGLSFWTVDRSLAVRSINHDMAALCGGADRGSMIGSPLSRVLSRASAQRLDALALKTQTRGKPMRNCLEAIEAPDGASAWFIVDCRPIRAGGIILGAAFFARRITECGRASVACERVAKAIEQVSADLVARIQVETLADSVGVSMSQLERDFTNVLGISPARYISMARFEMALDLLETGISIADVAHACGYADQSAFTRRFRSAMGVSPTVYRKGAAASASGRAR
ncbi:MAG: helix-turn-helix domain-containing protein [Hyphomonadaceae bacterium]